MYVLKINLPIAAVALCLADSSTNQNRMKTNQWGNPNNLLIRVVPSGL